MEWVAGIFLSAIAGVILKHILEPHIKRWLDRIPGVVRLPEAIARLETATSDLLKKYGVAALFARTSEFRRWVGYAGAFVALYCLLRDRWWEAALEMSHARSEFASLVLAPAFCAAVSKFFSSGSLSASRGFIFGLLVGGSGIALSFALVPEILREGETLHAKACLEQLHVLTCEPSSSAKVGLQ